MARRALGRWLDPASEAVREVIQELLSGSQCNVPSYRPPFYVLEHGTARTIRRCDTEIGNRTAATLDRKPYFDSEACARKAFGVERVEPHSAPVSDLGF